MLTEYCTNYRIRHRYQLSEAGSNAITALLAARHTVAADLIDKAA